MILVTGASGSVGTYVLNSLVKNKIKAVGVYNSVQLSEKCSFKEQLDLNTNNINSIFEKYNISGVIHCAAIKNIQKIANNSCNSFQLNVQVPPKIAEICFDKSIPYIFVSTDAVFDGKNSPYSETSHGSPISLYGEQKLCAESLVRSANCDAIICRLSKVFGVHIHDSILLHILTKIRNNEPLRLFYDVFRTPISGISAADGLLWCLNNVSGTIHLGGPERISWYEYGIRVARILGCSAKGIIPISGRHAKYAINRPVDVSLNSNLLGTLGYKMPELSRQIKDELLLINS